MAGNIPMAPPLAGFVWLSVFVHPDAGGQQDEQTSRYTTFGRVALSAAYAAAIHEISLQAFAAKHSRSVAYAAFINEWVSVYGWRMTMKSVPESVDLNDPQETKKIFETYVGAVMEQYGWQRLQEWISDLVTQAWEPPQNHRFVHLCILHGDGFDWILQHE